MVGTALQQRDHRRLVLAVGGEDQQGVPAAVRQVDREPGVDVCGELLGRPVAGEVEHPLRELDLLVGQLDHGRTVRAQVRPGARRETVVRMRLTSLRVYPVKSLRGYEVTLGRLEPWGLAEDRRWAVLTPSGEEVTAREVPELLRISARPTPRGVALAAPGHGDLTVDRPTSGPQQESDWIGRTTAAGPAAGAWLSAVVGRQVVLVHQVDPSSDRRVKAEHGGHDGDSVSLADTAPLLLTTEVSLRRLDELVAATAAERGEPAPMPLSMTRFRPNLVVDGERAFAEHDWARVRVGDVELRFAESCDRCVLPTYDPDTLARTHEPTRTLARHRSWGGKVWFGIRLIPWEPAPSTSATRSRCWPELSRYGCRRTPGHHEPLRDDDHS